MCGNAPPPFPFSIPFPPLLLPCFPLFFFPSLYPPVPCSVPFPGAQYSPNQLRGSGSAVSSQVVCGAKQPKTIWCIFKPKTALVAFSGDILNNKSTILLKNKHHTIFAGVCMCVCVCVCVCVLTKMN